MHITHFGYHIKVWILKAWGTTILKKHGENHACISLNLPILAAIERISGPLNFLCCCVYSIIGIYCLLECNFTILCYPIQILTTALLTSTTVMTIQLVLTLLGTLCAHATWVCWRCTRFKIHAHYKQRANHSVSTQLMSEERGS